MAFENKKYGEINMLKMVAFDLDGTIANTIPLCLEVFKKAVFPYTKRILSDEEIINTFGLNEAGMIRQIIPNKLESQEALKNYHELYEEMHYMCETPFAQINELLECLKQKGLTLTMVTGKGAESCEITLQKFALKNYFKDIKTGSKSKPNKADSIFDLMRKYQLFQDEIIYIGDTVSDVTTCNQLNICCLSAAWSPSVNLDALRAVNETNVFTTVESLQNYILKQLK